MSTIDIDAILSPLEGRNPSGENLRYDPVYDEIKEARRADDELDRGEWQQELKTSDWPAVIALCTSALSDRTKDLQVTVWLTEALIKVHGFQGLIDGLAVINGLMQQFWDTLYPEIEDDDLDFRAGPLEFLNDKVWVAIKEVPMTDPSVSPGYSWFKWQESRLVGSDAGIRNQYGDIDENKKKIRDALLADGKIPEEEFDAAVNHSSREFYISLVETIEKAEDEFRGLDKTVDEKFGRDAPRLAELGHAIDDCLQLARRLLKEKGEPEPVEITGSDSEDKTSSPPTAEGQTAGPTEQSSKIIPGIVQYDDAETMEKALWQQALQLLETEGIKSALDVLFTASCTAPSIRGQTRFRLLMAKLCLRAERHDLARPIMEQLQTSIEDLQLARWESPVWIAEVIDAMYQCLTSGEPTDDDMGRARELFRKLCNTDVTKALGYKTG